MWQLSHSARDTTWEAPLCQWEDITTYTTGHSTPGTAPLPSLVPCKTEEPAPDKQVRDDPIGVLSVSPEAHYYKEQVSSVLILHSLTVGFIHPSKAANPTHTNVCKRQHYKMGPKMHPHIPVLSEVPTAATLTAPPPALPAPTARISTALYGYSTHTCWVIPT